jgi:hypothetical protein
MRAPEGARPKLAQLEAARAYRRRTGACLGGDARRRFEARQEDRVGAERQVDLRDRARVERALGFEAVQAVHDRDVGDVLERAPSSSRGMTS